MIKIIKAFFKNIIETERNFNIVVVVVFLLALILINKIQSLGIFFIYVFLTLMYIKIINSSVKWANSVCKQVVWLIIAPIIIALLPFAIIERIIPSIAYQNSFFVPVYLFFFVITGVIAVLIFDLNKVKISIQIVNGIFLTILSLTFVFYFQADALFNFIEPDLANEILSANVSIESLFELLVKLITIPYILLGIWGNIAVSIREIQYYKR